MIELMIYLTELSTLKGKKLTESSALIKLTKSEIDYGRSKPDIYYGRSDSET